jgi:hypothetical protein
VVTANVSGYSSLHAAVVSGWEFDLACIQEHHVPAWDLPRKCQALAAQGAKAFLCPAEVSGQGGTRGGVGFIWGA